MTGDAFNTDGRMSLRGLRRFTERQRRQAMGVGTSGLLPSGAVLLGMSPSGLQATVAGTTTTFLARITEVGTATTATLLSPVTDSSTTFNVNPPATVPAVPFNATIGEDDDAEAITVTATLGSVWTVERDPENAVAHDADTTIILGAIGYGFQEQREGVAGELVDHEAGLSGTVADGPLAYPVDADATVMVDDLVEMWLAESRDHFLFQPKVSSSGYATIQEEGTPLTQRTKLNFVGAAITAADDSANTRTNVTLSASPDSNSVVGTGRTISTTTPLAGGGDLSADRTLTLAGLSSLGTGHYLVSVNSGGTGWEYKQIIASGTVAATAGAGTLTFALAGGTADRSFRWTSSSVGTAGSFGDTGALITALQQLLLAKSLSVGDPATQTIDADPWLVTTTNLVAINLARLSSYTEIAGTVNAGDYDGQVIMLWNEEASATLTLLDSDGTGGYAFDCPGDVDYDLPPKSGVLLVWSNNLWQVYGKRNALDNGDYGDVTASSGGSVITIDNDVVTFAKMQNVTGPTLLGKATSGSGDAAEVSPTDTGGGGIVAFNDTANTLGWVQSGGATSIGVLATAGATVAWSIATDTSGGGVFGYNDTANTAGWVQSTSAGILTTTGNVVSWSTAIQVGASEVVFNETGADLDLRCEGDNSTSLFKLDAGLDTVEITPTTTRASASGATLDSVNVKAATITVTGTTAITTATGFNLVTINAPTITDSSACAISTSATFYIGGSPSVGGSATIGTPLALWVDSGNCRFDDDVTVGGGLYVTGAATAGSLAVTGTTTVQGLNVWIPATCEGRLTLTSGTPVTTSDVTGAGTLYFTPYIGDRVALYDGSNWKLYSFTERSLSLSISASTLYYIYLYDSSGTLTLEASTTAYTTQDSVRVKSGTTTKRFLGWVYASGSNTTEDSVTKRYVVNWMNAVRRSLFICPAYSNGGTQTNYTTTSTTFTEANGSGNGTVRFVSNGVDAADLAFSLRIELLPRPPAQRSVLEWRRALWSHLQREATSRSKSPDLPQ